jgi:hypothetical protein
VRVFVSSSQREQGIARELAAKLDHDGVDTVTDADVASPGSDWRLDIEAAVDDADAYVVVIGEEPSRFDRVEWRSVINAHWSEPGKPVVPVVVGNADLPAAFRGFHVVHVASADDASHTADQIIATLQGPPPGPSSPPIDELRQRLDEIGKLNRAIAAEQ